MSRPRHLRKIGALVFAAALLAGSGVATAERSVAIVNLSSEDDAKLSAEAIATLRRALERRDDRTPTASNRALEDAVAPLVPVEPSILDGVREAYRKVELDEALAEVSEIEADLRAGEPVEDVFEALAQAAFLRGNVLAASSRPQDAVTAFTLAYRMRPDDGKLDPRRFPPKVRQLYEKAVARGAGERSPLVVKASPDAAVWVNGELAGRTPQNINVAPGAHYITVHRPGYETTTRIYTGGDEVDVQLEPLEGDERIQSLRRALVRVDDTGALLDLASLIDADDLVLVRVDDGQVTAALYDGDARRLGRWGDLRGDRLFGQPAGVRDLNGVAKRSEPTPSQSWYRTWWGKTAIVGGVLAIAVTFYVVGTAEDDYEVGGAQWTF